MGESKEYNGWTNYETWDVNLWITDDSNSDGYWREQAQEAYDNAKPSELFTKNEQATLDFSKALKEYFDDSLADMLAQSGIAASMWADLLGAALSDVNWHEIAEHFINRVNENKANA